MLPVKVTSLILLGIWVFMQAEATDLWLYDHNDYDKGKTFKRFNFGTSQRCYNIVDCFDNKASSASWINTPKETWFVFYDGEGCSGTQYVSTATPSGQMKFASAGLDNKLSSFMLWEYSIYPLKGIVDICSEDAILLSINNTDNSNAVECSSSGGNSTVGFL
ncbi:hypothetical protein KRP22_012434 [Phytophthora ramorum]|uniref:uncharacterized protein n=1 Tax=Phytophthora ramorum TaxID=164328 RepID=UPI0030B0D25E|nr:hypothetical protein KRP23_5191 [Phytophthora ramorum]KAH7497336.1 hypothetical protein KRP22_13168 [Phytophthora ramorum]